MPGLRPPRLASGIRVGARWETPEQNGIAHLFEHMAFKGAGGRDARQFAEAIGIRRRDDERRAPSYERTSYYARALTRDAPFALDMIADMILDPHWVADDLEKEKGVVAQERGEAFDQPDDRVFELHQEGAVSKSAARPPDARPGGNARARSSVAALEAFPRCAHDARAHRDLRRRRLRPRRDAWARSKALRRAAQARRYSRRRAIAAPRGVRMEQRKLEQAHLVLSWPGPASGAKDVYAARLMVGNLRRRHGLAPVPGRARDARPRLRGRFLSSRATRMSAASASMPAARQATPSSWPSARARSCWNWRKHGPTDKEIARAKAVVDCADADGRGRSAPRAQKRAPARFSCATASCRSRKCARKVDAVTARDVQAFAAYAVQVPAAPPPSARKRV